MEELKAKLNELSTMVEALSNAATAAEEANRHCTEQAAVFTPQMLKGLNEFIYNTIWAVRDRTRELKELAGKQD